MSTCFWTDLVGAQQVCPAPPPPPPVVPMLQNFIFGPVYAEAELQFNAPNWYTHRMLASDASFASWRAVGPTQQTVPFNTSYPASVVFTGPGDYVWQEFEESSYARADAYNARGEAYTPPELGGRNPGPSIWGYSDGFTYSGVGNTATARVRQSPPWLRHPTPIAASGARWWSPYGRLSYTEDGFNWIAVSNFPNASYDVATVAARAGIVATVCRNTLSGANRLVWSTNEGTSWNDIALAAGPIENLTVAVSPTQVYRTSGTGNTNAQFSNTTALGTATNVGGAFPKRRAWWTGTSWLVERLGTPVQIQRYTDLATAGASVFSFPAGAQPCGAFLALGGGRIVVPALLSSPANHVDFYVSQDDGLTFAVVPGMRLSLGYYGSLDPNYAVPGFNITYRPPI